MTRDDRPDRHDVRLRKIGPLWLVETFQPCPCPDCNADGHWRYHSGGHATRKTAQAEADRLWHKQQHPDA